MDSSIIVLFGPTASGKTWLGVALAKALQNAGKSPVVINADSKQVYKEIPIITAQPTEEEKEAIPHLLYGTLSASVHCTVAMWVELAAKAIKEAFAKGQVPILVGGTGMYINALVHGYSNIPSVDAEVREEVREKLAALGNEAFYHALEERDPEIARTLNPGDTTRILRAYEVMEQTGQSLLYWQQQKQPPAFPDATILQYFLNRPRDLVYEKVNRRFEGMVDEGVVEEVEALDAMGLDETLPAMKAHGVPEIRNYLHGKMTLEEAIDIAQRNTRHYVKRQYTWFRHQMTDITSLDGEGIEQVLEQLLEDEKIKELL